MNTINPKSKKNHLIVAVSSKENLDPDQDQDQDQARWSKAQSEESDQNDYRMKVLVRIRPYNSFEATLSENDTPTIQANNDEKTLQIFNSDGKISVMSFNRVYGDSSDQKVFFETSGVVNLVSKALQGYVTTVFAFGQTGSGKTFTITGPAEANPDPVNVGIVPRALEYLFSQVETMKKSKHVEHIRIQASYMEIYNENVLDLINPQNSGLPVRWSAERGFYVERLVILDCDSLDDCLAVLEEGLRNRTTAAHEMHEHSSRSHSILTIYMEIQALNQDKLVQNRYGKISFVDLAGSEKVKESKVTQEMFAEALSINKSLLTLGKCISALAGVKSRSGHIPFRDSKLTKLLADSLSGKGLALMIACVSPASQNLNETLKTVRYAMQARKIQNRAVIQLDPQEEILVNLKVEIQTLKKENLRLRELLEKDKSADKRLATLKTKYDDHSPELLNINPEAFKNTSSHSRKGTKDRAADKRLAASPKTSYTNKVPELPNINLSIQNHGKMAHSRKATKTKALPNSSIAGTDTKTEGTVSLSRKGTLNTTHCRRDTTNTTHSRKGTTTVHSRRETTNGYSRFGAESQSPTRKAINSLPSRLTEPRAKKLVKSAAKRRIEEMTISHEPASGRNSKNGRYEQGTKKRNYKVTQNPSPGERPKKEVIPKKLKEPFQGLDNILPKMPTKDPLQSLDYKDDSSKNHKETLKEIDILQQEIQRLRSEFTKSAKNVPAKSKLPTRVRA